MDSDPDYTSFEEDAEVSVGQVVMAMQPNSDHSSVSQALKKKNRTLRFKGFVGNQEVLILLDSRSAGTFVSLDIAAKIHGE